MKVIILGSGIGIPSANRGSPGYYITFNDEQFLVDSGSGTLRSVVKAGINYETLDGVFYTHFHIDHTGDMIPLYFSLKENRAIQHRKNLLLYGPLGLQELFDQSIQPYFTSMRKASFDVDIHELNDGQQVTKNGGVTVTARYVAHTDSSVGYRFATQDGKSVVFSGDTGKCSALIELSRDADVAIFECSAPEEYAEKYGLPTHLTPTWAGQIAEQAGVKKLILSHIHPDTDRYPIARRCKKQFGGEVVIAQDGMIIEI
jgi:ribonuclease BN (tRNA processing enzyme)